MMIHRARAIPLVASCLLATGLGVVDAGAHARWFIDDTQVVLHPEFRFDGLCLAMLVGAMLFVAAAMTFEMGRVRLPALDRWLGRPLAPTLGLWRLLAAVFGATLMINSLTQVFVAPNLAANGSMVLKSMLFLQVLVGGMFFVQARLTWACTAVLLMPVLCAWEFSSVHAIDYAFELAGIALAVLLMAPALATADLRTQTRMAACVPTGFSLNLRMERQSYGVVWSRINPWRYDPRSGLSPQDREALAIAVLRTLFGLQLIVLSAHDKLLEPGVSLAFVDKYSFVNVPALLGASQFTNLHFVFGAGLAEIAFGTLLLANVAVRGTCAILLALFTTTGVVFGIEEMVGHLPIIAMLVLLMVSGSPQLQSEPSIGRWQIASLSSVGATLIGLISIFMVNGTAAPELPASIHASAAVPAALYKRFAATAYPERPAIAETEQTVRDILAGADQPVDKNKLAESLFMLSMQYETIYGSDSASQWLRYAHLTASCSFDDVQAFRSRVASVNWRESVPAVHDPLADELLALARPDAEAILKRSVDPRDPAIWPQIATLAPPSGPDYVHTHNLAAITRIIFAVAQDTGRYPSLLAS